MLRPILAAFATAAVLLTSPAAAQPGTAAAAAGEPIVLGTSHEIASAALKAKRRVNVRLPASYAASKDRRYPVLYVLDGGVEQDFPHMAGLAQHGEASATFDEMIVVGVPTEKRIWELTFPSRDARYATFYRANGQPVEFASGGGSAAFRRHIAEEVIPYVERSYRTDGRRILIGESLAGLFVVDTLLKQPKLFDDYVSISPSMWWDLEALGERAGELLKAQDYAGRRFYVTMASEGGTGQRALDKLLAALRSPASGALKWVYVDRRDSEHHGSIYHLAALDALRTLQPKPWRPGSPLPWLFEGEMPPLSEAAQADKKIPCTAERAARVAFAQIRAEPERWEALCVLSPLGQAPAPRERSANWPE